MPMFASTLAAGLLAISPEVVHTIIGSAVEIFVADLFNVLGLAVQKIAVMKIIETNRVLRTKRREARGGSLVRSASGLGAYDDQGRYFEVDPDDDPLDFGGVDLTPILSETQSEVMTVYSDAPEAGKYLFLLHCARKDRLTLFLRLLFLCFFAMCVRR